MLCWASEEAHTSDATLERDHGGLASKLKGKGWDQRRESGDPLPLPWGHRGGGGHT